MRVVETRHPRAVVLTTVSLSARQVQFLSKGRTYPAVDLLHVNVTVASYGSFVETVQVQLLANQTRILAVESVSVKPLSSVIIDLLWNTAGYPASTYELSVLALPVQGETNLENNSYGNAIVKLTEPSTGPAPSSSLTGLSLGTEEVILISFGEALLGLFLIGRRLSGRPRKPVSRTKRP